ncbi:glycosyltransferase family 2 protein [uncultured Polaribacter sp.]|uniref:glycosyltransferase family 2 protein n=1 Tax=uncultured Polaribacter sp. TaxID=174711 RepID=UPI0030D7CA78|tara:strand:+ start:25306 stop:26169 length:864 start_codon:yes stop_codon:yes gene_type:complete
MHLPLISIITSTFNSDKTLLDTIDSILNQTYKNIEYIVVDGNSTDKTVEILKSVEHKFKEKEISFNWISEPDKGIYDAWNKALNLVTGEWIAFIGSDDYFKNKNVFSETIPYLKKAVKESCNYVYGVTEHIDKEDKLIEVSGKPWDVQKERFPYTMNLPHSGCFHHKKLFLKHGFYNDSFKIVGDYEFLLRELKDKNNKAYFVDKVFTVMREGGVSASLDNRLIVIKENHKARKLNNISTFSKELFFWEIRVRGIFIIMKIFGNKSAAKLADSYRKIVLRKQKRWSV